MNYDERGITHARNTLWPQHQARIEELWNDSNFTTVEIMATLLREGISVDRSTLYLRLPPRPERESRPRWYRHHARVEELWNDPTLTVAQVIATLKAEGIKVDRGTLYLRLPPRPKRPIRTPTKNIVVSEKLDGTPRKLSKNGRPIGRPANRKNAPPIRNVNKLAALTQTTCLGDNLWVQVTESGSKSFFASYTRHGQQKKIGLGSARYTTLAEAREQTFDIMRNVHHGRAPMFRDNHTVWEAVEAWLPVYQDEVEPVTYKAAKVGLEKIVKPIIGATRLSELTHDLALQAFNPFWRISPDQSNDARQHLQRALTKAKVSGWCKDETVDIVRLDNLRVSLPSPNMLIDAQHEMFPMIDWRHIREFTDILGTYDGEGALCLRLLQLTALRPIECAKALWPQFDFEAKTWTLPASVIKTRRQMAKDKVKTFVVPLSDAAIALLKSLPRQHPEYVFSSSAAVLMRNALAQLYREHPEAATRFHDPESGKLAVPHGLARATFRTWVNDQLCYPSELAEVALNHQTKSRTEAAYQRSDSRSPRAALMNDYATFLGY